MVSYTLLVFLGLVLALLASAFRVLREYERGVVFMLGRFWKVKVTLVPSLPSLPSLP